MGEYTNNLYHDRDRDREQDEDEDEEEEAAVLSLCDFPLQDRSKESPNVARRSTERSSSQSAEFFEFFSDISSEMRSAEDIIFHGKLVPFKEPDHFPPSTPTPSRQCKEDPIKRISLRRRCESLSEIQSSVTRSDSTKNDINIALTRNSRSLDYRKLERYFSSSRKFSPELVIERSWSFKSTTKGDVKKTFSRPRWYLLMFGVVKPPTEMDLTDIKSRQVRRNSSMTMFQTEGKMAKTNQSCISKGSCRLLRVLSCKDPASVGVTTSFLVPQV